MDIKHIDIENENPNEHIAISKKTNKPRNTFLDIVKYFTMFLVIWGHVVQQSFMASNTTSPFNDFIYQTIYTMHMPLFMGLCGYFYSQSICSFNGIKEYIDKKLLVRLKTLIIPMFVVGGQKLYLKV